LFAITPTFSRECGIPQSGDKSGEKTRAQNPGLQPKWLVCFGLKSRIMSEFVFSGMNAGVINKNSSLS